VALRIASTGAAFPSPSRWRPLKSTSEPAAEKPSKLSTVDDFEVTGFMEPHVVMRRKSDGKKGSLTLVAETTSVGTDDLDAIDDLHNAFNAGGDFLRQLLLKESAEPAFKDERSSIKRAGNAS
jgi:hypothetical protein